MTIRESLQENLRECEQVNNLLQACPALANANGSIVGQLIYVTDGFPASSIPPDWTQHHGNCDIECRAGEVRITLKDAAKHPLPLERDMAEHKAYLDKLEAKLHELEAHPDWEYWHESFDHDQFERLKACGWSVNTFTPSEILALRRRKISPAQTTENQTNTAH